MLEHIGNSRKISQDYTNKAKHLEQMKQEKQNNNHNGKVILIRYFVYLSFHD